MSQIDHGITGPIPKPGKTPKNRVSKEWLAFRKQWLKDHPPAWNDTYTCRLCGHAVHKSVVQLDHIKSRSTHPHLRLDINNVQPVHGHCNTQKKISGQ